MRRTARENAFKLIFEKSVSGGTGEISYTVLTHSMTDEENEYFNSIVNLADKNRPFLVKALAKYAHGYELDRIYRIDLSILLVAMTEILFNDDVPDKVAVNEALEMAKVYSTDNSPSFINGILASVIRDKEELISESKDN